MRKILLISVLMMSPAAAVYAHPRETGAPPYMPSTAMDFSMRCGTHREVYEDPSCAAYVWGIVKGLHAAHAKAACPPADALQPQLMTVVLDYMHDHPEILNQEDAEVIVRALGKAFPCR